MMILSFSSLLGDKVFLFGLRFFIYVNVNINNLYFKNKKKNCYEVNLRPESIIGFLLNLGFVFNSLLLFEFLFIYFIIKEDYILVAIITELVINDSRAQRPNEYQESKYSSSSLSSILDSVAAFS
jgi:hypothetical protein